MLLIHNFHPTCRIEGTQKEPALLGGIGDLANFQQHKQNYL